MDKFRFFFPLGYFFCFLGLHQWAFVDIYKTETKQITIYKCLCCEKEIEVTKTKKTEKTKKADE